MESKSVERNECKAMLENERQCCETSSMTIFSELNREYRRKIESVDDIEIKIEIYSTWVSDLTCQNTQLISVIEDLEKVTCSRLHLLESKLESDYAYHRIKDKSNWHARELGSLATLNNDIHEKKESQLKVDSPSNDSIVKKEQNSINLCPVERAKQNSETENKTIREEEIDSPRVLEENKILHETINELKAQINQYEEKMTADIQGLVMEVAEKHDTILQCRREIIDLEDQLKLKDTHITFKEQIIKEFRRECKKPSPRSIDAASSNTDSFTTVIDNDITLAINENYKIKKFSENQSEHKIFKITKLIEKMYKARELGEEILYEEIDELINCQNYLIDELKNKCHGNDQIIEHVLMDLSRLINEVLGIKLDTKSIEQIKTGNTDVLSNLMVDLQNEITTKDNLLKSQSEKIHILEEHLENYKKDLFDINRKYENIIKERKCELITIENLNSALSAHVDTISKLQAQNEQLSQEQLNLQKSLSEQINRNAFNLEKNQKLENECEQQLLTITNLRLALENCKRDDLTKKAPEKSKKGSDSSGSGSWNWWRNVHDV